MIPGLEHTRPFHHLPLCKTKSATAFTTLDAIFSGKEVTECRYLKPGAGEAMKPGPLAPGFLPRDATAEMGVTFYRVFLPVEFIPPLFPLSPKLRDAANKGRTDHNRTPITPPPQPRILPRSRILPLIQRLPPADAEPACSAIAPSQTAALGKAERIWSCGLTIARLLWGYDFGEVRTPGKGVLWKA